MAWRKRILIEPDAFRASKAGVDVERAALDEMSFDSRFAFVGKAESNSFILRPRQRWNEPGTTSYQFNQNFGDPPFFVFHWVIGSGGAATQRGQWIPPSVKNLKENPSAQNPQAMKVVEAEITNRSVRFRNWVWSDAPSRPGGRVRVRFKALV